MNKDRQKLIDWRTVAVNTQIGDMIICPSCESPHQKKRKTTVFCSTRCKDHYWNNVDEKKRNAATRNVEKPKPQHSFFATLSAVIEFSDEEFNLVCEHAAHHYDTKVKMSVEVGGFLFGAKGSRDWAKSQLLIDPKDDLYTDYKSREYKNRDIQLMMKAIEFTHSKEAAAVYWKLNNIIREMGEKQNEINKKLNK